MTSQPVLTLEPKLHPQLAADTQVPRTALLDRLEASSPTPVAAIQAPPGYGKTTLLAQWAERDPRAFGWLTINRGDNDPGVLLRDLAAALDRIEPLGPGMAETPDAPEAAVVDVVLPQLGSALASTALPAVLVLDDVHLLENRDCLDVVTRLIELTRRAAGWCEANGLPAQAVEYAIAAGDADQAASVVAAAALPAYADGRLERWLGWFEVNRLVDRYPAVAALGAWVKAVGGHPAAAERWAEAASRARSGVDGPPGAAPQGPLALLAAASCRDGVDQMGCDAGRALAEAPTGSPWQAWAQLLLGIARLLAGDPDVADHHLADAAEVGEDAGVDAAVVALAERSLLAMTRGDWQQAEALAQRAAAGARRAWLERYPVGALLRAVTARLAIHRGDVARARDDLALAERLGAGLTWALPHLAVQVRLELARNYLALTDAAAARTALREVDDLLARRPRLGILGDQAAELRAQLEAMRAAAVGAASLTAAELRLLRLLGTHFSFREIGDQLRLSQHTVKSQAMSIYRKFGMSSRSEAIRHARDLGLLVE